MSDIQDHVQTATQNKCGYGDKVSKLIKNRLPTGKSHNNIHTQ